MGAVFAASPEQYRSADLGRAEPAIRDIAVWDASGAQQARLDADRAQPLPRPVLTGARMVFRRRACLPRGPAASSRCCLIRRSLMPGSCPRRRWYQREGRGGTAGARRAGLARGGPDRIDERATLEGWTGALPLYLFVILGPALAGAWLAALFVGSFERQAKAARAIRALKSMRPVEARLMVRLANAERGAMEALRSKSEFIAHMSHELRTPLNAVIGFSEIIADGLFGPAGHPKYGEYARDIADAGKNLHAKIGDILEFANIEAGRFPLKEEAVELADAVARLRSKNIRAAPSPAASRCRWPLASRARCAPTPRASRRILSNLLTNALTYTAEGGIVRADVRFEEGAGVLTLSDSGAGFSPREARRLGKPFERFDRAGTVTGAGPGPGHRHGIGAAHGRGDAAGGRERPRAPPWN